MSSEFISHSFNDIQDFSNTREITDEGFIRTDARMSRVGIAEYMAGEFGNFELFGVDSSKDIIRVYRPSETLFNDSTLRSFEGKPVTNNHPDGNVNPKNAKDVQVGHIGDNVRRDDDSMRARLTITDESAINAINEGKVGLSIGYSGELKIQKGITDDGEKFDAVLTNMKGNHVALTNSPRAGIKCKLLDENLHKIEGKKMTTVNFSGKDVEVSDQASQTLNDDLKEMKVKCKSLSDEVASLKKDKEVLSGTVDALKEQISDSESFDLAVSERVELIDSVRRFLPDDFEFSGKSEREINIEFIKKIHPDFIADEKSDEYLRARADQIFGFEKLHKNSDPFGINAVNSARNEMLNDSNYEVGYGERKRQELISKQKERNNNRGGL
jgi:hypothetical protein